MPRSTSTVVHANNGCAKSRCIVSGARERKQIRTSDIVGEIEDFVDVVESNNPNDAEKEAHCEDCTESNLLSLGQCHIPEQEERKTGSNEVLTCLVCCPWHD